MLNYIYFKCIFCLATELGRQYSSVFVEPFTEWAVNNVNEFFQPDHVGDGQSLTDMFTEEDIEAACAELKSSSAVGADVFLPLY